MTPYAELYCDQGTTFNHIINLTDDVDNSAINVAAYTSITSQVRRSHISQNASANIVCTVTNAGEGEITLSMSASVTSNLRAGRYNFDVKAVDSANNVSRILEGLITVTPQVTR
jgi:hypothetical protein